MVKMTVLSTVRTAVVSSYRGASHAGPILTTQTAQRDGSRLINKAVKPGDKLVTIDLSAIPRTTSETVKRTAPVVATNLAFGLAFNALALEVIDAIENQVEKRARRDQLHQVIARVGREGLSDETNAQLAVLSRADERRTFGQWVRDLPYRTTRRVVRVCYVELGYWYMVVSSPLWVPVMLADLAYSFLAVPAAALFSKYVLRREMNVDKALGLRDHVTLPVLRWTLFAGWKVFTKGVSMRLYNRNVTRANTNAYMTFEVAKANAHVVVPTISDGHTAFAWGEALAEGVQTLGGSELARQQAYSQASYWVEDNIVPDFQKAVIHGFRSGVPLMYRDMVMVPVTV